MDERGKILINSYTGKLASIGMNLSGKSCSVCDQGKLCIKFFPAEIYCSGIRNSLDFRPKKKELLNAFYGAHSDGQEECVQAAATSPYRLMSVFASSFAEKRNPPIRPPQT